MKKLFICLMASQCFIACNQDDNASTISHGSPNQKVAIESPSNASNPFDNAGAIFDQVFDAYYQSPPSHPTVAQISTRVDQLAAQNTLFVANKPYNYQNVLASEVSYIVNNPITSPLTVTNAMTLSPAAKMQLQSFAASVVSMSYSEETYQPIHDFICQFEEGVKTSTSLTSFDKQVLLTTASIARFSSFRKKKRPKKNTDPEWDLLVGHLIGAADRSQEGVCAAATMSLATGIAENN